MKDKSSSFLLQGRYIICTLLPKEIICLLASKSVWKSELCLSVQSWKQVELYPTGFVLCENSFNRWTAGSQEWWKEKSVGVSLCKCACTGGNKMCFRCAFVHVCVCLWFSIRDGRSSLYDLLTCDRMLLILHVDRVRQIDRSTENLSATIFDRL